MLGRESGKKQSKNEFLDVPSSNESEMNRILYELTNSEIPLNMNPNEPKPLVKGIKPTPGFCIKARDENNEKIFINICHCLDLPKPRDLTESELFEILSSDEPSSYRIPMSLGEPHKERDKSGKECTCYDVIINSEYFESIKSNDLFRRFLITVSYEGVQDKYGVNIDGESCIVLKNKTYHGVMPDHHIRCKPMIVDLGSTPYTPKSSQKNTSSSETIDVKKEEKVKTICPEYVLRKIPASGYPNKLILEVNLPNLVTSETVSLNVGEDRIVLHEKINSYDFDIFLPYLINQQQCSAEFKVSEKVLTLDMPVIPNANENVEICS